MYNENDFLLEYHKFSYYKDDIYLYQILINQFSIGLLKLFFIISFIYGLSVNIKLNNIFSIHFVPVNVCDFLLNFSS